ncbi:C2H2-type zinc finger protein [bacterium]|nr:C2H2-type zinc finger protein [bacterium]
MVHDKIKDFECDKCDATFSKNSDLQRHIKAVHNKIKDQECPDCEYKFSSNGNLQAHIKQVHNKIKDFECPDCDYKCCTNGNLQAHINRVHYKIKDFECDKCEYKCSQNAHLQQHINMVHDKIKDFECPDCEYKFGLNGTLQRHIKAVHDKIKDFECPDCEYKCSTNSDLQQHISTCTGEMKCSSGEYRVMQVLESMRIDYHYNTTHEVKSTNWLRWDFMIDYNNTKIFIEYNGRQHYRPVQFGGISMERATENFRKQQINDQIKTDYCTENDYPLLWISHKDNVEDSVRKFIVDNTNWDGDKIDGTNWGE